MVQYDVAQVCPNGHLITSYATKHPQCKQVFCETCGEETIMKCPKCGSLIRGGYNDFGGSLDSPPPHCIYCGAAFPWTELKRQAALDMVDELEDLKDKEKEMLKKSIDDIILDLPQTTVAATRLKKFFLKAGKGTASALRDIVVDIASETARKILQGP